VVDFVLVGERFEPRGIEDHNPPVRRGPFHDGLLEAPDVSGVIGHTETAFAYDPGTVLVQHPGIDEHDPSVPMGSLFARHIHHDHSHRIPDLRRGERDARGGLEGVEQVLDKVG